MFRNIILVCLLIINLSARENILVNTTQNEVFLLPKDGKIIKNKIENLIENSKSSITIAMYNFSYEKFAQKLIQASKKGLDIRVVLDKKNKKENKKIYKLLKKSNIKIKLIDEKMHLKVAIFDKQNILLGSANWTKKSFKENYEIVLLSKDRKNIEKISSFILSL